MNADVESTERPAEAAASAASAPKANWRERLELKAPRTYNFFFKVVLPVFCILPFCILCGFFLAKIEAPNEMASNNAAMADLVHKLTNLDRISNATYARLHECYNTFDGTPDVMVNATEFLQDYRSHIFACDDEIREANEPIIQDFKAYFFGSMASSLTFDWIRCGSDGSRKEQPAMAQFANFANQWVSEFWRLWAEYGSSSESLSEGMDPIDLAIDDADGTEHCEVNVAGGSIFWWTIMTTVGYGNTAPSTSGGRALVYTLGFVSILAFAAILGQAGYTMLVISDDFFLRVKLKRLAGGFLSMLFWLAIMVLWFCVVAAFRISYTRDHYPVNEGIMLQFSEGASFLYQEDPMTFSDGFWYSFITGTTVGLGDIHIGHDMFTITDMFVIPLLFLISFVFLSNFAIKLTGIIGPYFEEGEELYDILEKRRLSRVAACGSPNTSRNVAGKEKEEEDEENKSTRRPSSLLDSGG